MVVKQTRTVTCSRGSQSGACPGKGECDVTGPGVVWTRGMGCEARKDGHIERDFVCLAKVLGFVF